MKRVYIIILISQVAVQLSLSQTEKPDSSVNQKPDTVAVRGVDWLAYPNIFYSPETSLAFGGCRIYFDINQAF